MDMIVVPIKTSNPGKYPNKDCGQKVHPVKLHSNEGGLVDRCGGDWDYFKGEKKRRVTEKFHTETARGQTMETTWKGELFRKTYQRHH